MKMKGLGPDEKIYKNNYVYHTISNAGLFVSIFNVTRGRCWHWITFNNRRSSLRRWVEKICVSKNYFNWLQSSLMEGARIYIIQCTSNIHNYPGACSQPFLIPKWMPSWNAKRHWKKAKDKLYFKQKLPNFNIATSSKYQAAICLLISDLLRNFWLFQSNLLCRSCFLRTCNL